MALYYVFYSKNRYGRPFQKKRSLCSALAAAKGDEKRVYKHIDGIPNPWWTYGIKNGRVDKMKIYKGIPNRRLNKLKPLGILD